MHTHTQPVSCERHSISMQFRALMKNELTAAHTARERCRPLERADRHEIFGGGCNFIHIRRAATSSHRRYAIKSWREFRAIARPLHGTYCIAFTPAAAVTYERRHTHTRSAQIAFDNSPHNERHAFERGRLIQLYSQCKVNANVFRQSSRQRSRAETK